MRALIIVDVQNDFLPGGALSVPDGGKIIPVINDLQDRFDLVVATQDWHPLHHGSFASSHEGKEPFDVIDLDGMKQTLWPDHCVQGTKGAEFAADLEMNRVEAIFRKGTDPQIDSYSGFYDNGHQKATGLADYLRGKDVRKIFVTGLAAEICVFFTAMDGLKEGFETAIIQQGTQPLSSEDCLERMRRFASEGGELIDGPRERR